MFSSFDLIWQAESYQRTSSRASSSQRARSASDVTTQALLEEAGRATQRRLDTAAGFGLQEHLMYEESEAEVRALRHAVQGIIEKKLNKHIQNWDVSGGRTSGIPIRRKKRCQSACVIYKRYLPPQDLVQRQVENLDEPTFLEGLLRNGEYHDSRRSYYTIGRMRHCHSERWNWKNCHASNN